MRWRMWAIGLVFTWLIGVVHARWIGEQITAGETAWVVQPGARVPADANVEHGRGNVWTHGGNAARLLADGHDAYLARLRLIATARQRLDLQYYWLEDDASTRGLLSAVRAAARRGVRVRMLFDDLSAVRQSRLLGQMASLPNIEIRVFNPFVGGRASFPLRWLFALGDLDRLTRRMHNKLMIADGRMSIVGGRNLTDANFGMDATANLVDLDLLTAGVAVDGLADVFDRYWHSRLAVPLATLNNDRMLRPAEAMVTAIPAAVAGTDADLAVTRMSVSEREAVAHLPVAGPGRVLADDPSKIGPQPGGNVRPTVYDAVAARLRDARREVVIVSPYFVPGPDLMADFAALRRRGVVIRVLTNALAVADQPSAHAAYSRLREDLLRLGVDLHEFGAGPSARGGAGVSTALHGKAVVIDRRVVYIGSMNFDPLSRTSNTEVGVLMDDRMLAAQLLDLFRGLVSPRQSYIVRLAPDHRGLEWIERIGDHVAVHRTDPGAGWQRRWSAPLLAAVVPERLH